MIEVWSWPTPNGQKVHIALEELALPYTLVPVDLTAGAQFAAEFTAITLNQRIPAIVDLDGPDGRIAVFESGAILIYLAEKAGRLIPRDAAARYACLQWLMFQVSGVGPIFGQYHHFTAVAPERIAYAVDRAAKEVRRIYGVVDARLSTVAYLASEYSIADIALFTWLRGADKRSIDLLEFPAVARWLDTINARPAVQRGLAVLADDWRDGPANANRQGSDGVIGSTPRIGHTIGRDHPGR